MGFFTKASENPSAYLSDRLRWGRVVAVSVVAVWALLTAIIAWPLAKVDQGEACVSYGGGLFEGRHFQGVKRPGPLFFNGWGDKLFCYPSTQRNYIVSSREGEGDVEGADLITATTADSVAVQFEVATYFKLNTNDDVLQRFHEEIGLKYHAWESDGWNAMLNDSFRQQIENALQELARTYDVEALYSDPETLETIQTQVGKTLRKRVAETLGGDYFCGPTFVIGHQPGTECGPFTFSIKRIGVPAEVAAAFEANRTSEIKVKTKQNEIEQRKAEAQAIRELNAALAEAGDQYVLLKAIESGQIKFWIIPSGQTITVPANP